MKKFGFLIPVLMLLLFMGISSRVMTTGSVNPLVLAVITLAAMVLLVLTKPKAKTSRSASEFEQKSRGEFAKDAFANDPKLGNLFRAAVKDYCGNMPKAALAKLTKLAAQCTADEDIYAVSMATAQCHMILGKPLPAIREYTRALTLHPSVEVALELGSCHQRLGNLEKARDSYEFALDLDENNLDALSRIATTYVADHDFSLALEYANRVIDKDEDNSSALATAAICHGLLGDSVMCSYYTNQAVDNGYSKQKIESTVATLKKRVK